MCVGNWFKAPKMPAPPPLPPTPKPAPVAPMPKPQMDATSAAETLERQDPDEKISTRKKKALEIQKVRRGVKEFGAINPAQTPNTPTGGVTPPT